MFGVDILMHVFLSRNLGYFRSHRTAVLKDSGALPLVPCYGPEVLDPKKGVCMVGACPWVINYNVPVTADNVAAAKPVCDKIREAKGGLKGVQAMALRNKNGVEIACNLLSIDVAGPKEVQEALAAACKAAGIKINTPYVIGLVPEVVMKRTADILKLDVPQKHSP